MPTRLIATIVMFIAALAIGFFFTWPKYQDFQQIQAELSRKELELNSKTDYYTQFKNMWEKLEKYPEALSLADSAIPQTYSLPSLFNFIQKTAGESGMVLENLSFQGVSGQGPLKEISFGLEVSGSYASFKSFLSSLENSLRIFKVKSVSFSSPKKDEKSFSFNLKIATYSY